MVDLVIKSVKELQILPTDWWISPLSTSTDMKTPRHLKVLCLISSSYYDAFKNYSFCLQQSKTLYFLVHISMCMKAETLRYTLQDARIQVQK